MRLSLRRKESKDQANSRLGIVIISGSCCIPGMAPFDEQAQRVVEQAVVATGVSAEVKVMPATTAMFGGAPKKVMAKLVADFNQGGKIGLPAILINGEAISYGVPTVENVKAALRQAVDANTGKGVEANE